MAGVKKYILQRRKNAKKASAEARRKRQARMRGESITSACTGQPTPSTSSAPTQPGDAPGTTKRRRRLGTPEQQADTPLADKEYLVIEKNYPEHVMTKLTCGRCLGSVTVSFVPKTLNCGVDVVCGECSSKEVSGVTEKPVTNMVVYSGSQSGIEYNGLHKFLGNVRMKPLAKKYFQHAKIVTEATKEKTASLLDRSVSTVKKYYSEKLKVEPDRDGVYDIRVLFDGTWQKRGHTSLVAAGAVIDAETGLVIDYETISKFCDVCSKKAKKTTEKEFNVWFEGHKDQCKINYTGKSGGMEAAAAVTLFCRSLAKKLRYKVFISDGDSSAYDAVCMINNGEGPYGDVKVEKGECINHVAKRLGTALRKLMNLGVTEETTKKGNHPRMNRLGERGKLTDYAIDKLTQYYGDSIRRNVSGSVRQMRKDIYASFLHCLSSNENPQHSLCPKTLDSWCFYERAKANNQVPPSHKMMKVHVVLPSELRQKVWGAYRRLTSDKLLLACIMGKTQNAREHHHSRIWTFCSKYKNANKQILDYALAQAVSDYNTGCLGGYVEELLGSEPSCRTTTPTA